jgi:hypothetical protein
MTPTATSQDCNITTSQQAVEKLRQKQQPVASFSAVWKHVGSGVPILRAQQ